MVKFVSKDYTNVDELSTNDYICFCLEVDKDTINKAIQNGAKTLKEIRVITNACTGNDCKILNPTGKCCSAQINKLIQKYKGK